MGFPFRAHSSDIAQKLLEGNWIGVSQADWTRGQRVGHGENGDCLSKVIFVEGVLVGASSDKRHKRK
jgi:hypothetical protein